MWKKGYILEQGTRGLRRCQSMLLFLRWKIYLRGIFLERNLFWKEVKMALLPCFFSDCASSHYIKTLPLFLIHNLVMKKVVLVLVFYVL